MSLPAFRTSPRDLLLAAAFSFSACAAQTKEVATPAAPEPQRKTFRAADEDMQVQGIAGTLEPEQVEETVKAGGAAIQACVREGQAAHWYLAGPIEMKWKVNADGTVKEAFIEQPLGDADVERCVIVVAKALKFPAPAGGGDAECGYTMHFRGKAQLKEWGEAEVAKVFAARRAEVEGCLRGDAQGVRVTVFVGPGGAVGSAGVGAEKAIDDGAVQCVVGKVRTWKFDDPRGKMARATWLY